MTKENAKKVWVKPEIKEIGNAKDIVAAVNTVGGGDASFSVLDPS